MIFKNKIRAVVSIPIGLLVVFCAAVLHVSQPEFRTILDVTMLTGYSIYLWGCFDVIEGKGYSKWLTFLFFIIPAIPGLIILLLLRDRNREERSVAEKKATRLAIALTTVTCLWVGSIFVLRVFLDIFVVPVLSQWDNTVRELRLPASRNSSDEVYLMGLKMRLPEQGLTTGSVVPRFDHHHQLQGMVIFFNDGHTPTSLLLLDRHPDELGAEQIEFTPPSVTLYNILFFNNSRFHFIDAMYRVRLSDFSWWNPIHDIRLAYILLEKALMFPLTYGGGASYRLETGSISAYLFRHKTQDDKYITRLFFKKGNSFYDIVTQDRRDCDYGAMLSSIHVASEAEAERIIEGYAARGVDREIELASRMSLKVTSDHLEEMIRRIEQHQSMGEKTIRKIAHLKAELAYLKSGGH